MDLKTFNPKKIATIVTIITFVFCILGVIFGNGSRSITAVTVKTLCLTIECIFLTGLFTLAGDLGDQSRYTSIIALIISVIVTGLAVSVITQQWSGQCIETHIGNALSGLWNKVRTSAECDTEESQQAAAVSARVDDENNNISVAKVAENVTPTPGTVPAPTPESPAFNNGQETDPATLNMSESISEVANGSEGPEGFEPLSHYSNYRTVRKNFSR